MIKRKIGLEGVKKETIVRKIRDEPKTTKTTVTPPKGFKTVRKCLTLGTIPDFRFLEKA